MKNKRHFALVLAYLFFLTLLPIGLISIKANAQESDSSIPAYLNYNPTPASIVQYKDKSIIIEYNDAGFKMSIADNGESKLVSGLSSQELSELHHIDGMYNNCMYFMQCEYANSTIKIYSLDLNSCKLSLYKSVNLMDGEKEYYDSIISAAVDNDGVCWFLFSTSSNEQFPSDPYWEIIKSTNGYHRIVDMSSHMNTINSMALGLDGNMWIVSSTLSNNSKLYKVSKNVETEYDISNNESLITNCFVDSKSNIYLDFMTPPPSTIVYDLKSHTLKQYAISGKSLSLIQELKNSETTPAGIYTMDSSGNMWLEDEAAEDQYSIIYKLDNNEFVQKYKVMRFITELSVYDDNHLAICGELGYTIISKNDSTTNVPTTVPATPQITPSSKSSLSNAGSVLNVDTLAFAGIAFIGAGSFVLLRKRKTK